MARRKKVTDEQWEDLEMLESIGIDYYDEDVEDYYAAEAFIEAHRSDLDEEYMDRAGF